MRGRKQAPAKRIVGVGRGGGLGRLRILSVLLLRIWFSFSMREKDLTGALPKLEAYMLKALLIFFLRVRRVGSAGWFG